MNSVDVAGRYQVPGQADHRVILAPDADALAELEAGFDIGDGFIVSTLNLPAGNQIARRAGLAGCIPTTITRASWSACRTCMVR